MMTQPVEVGPIDEATRAFIARGDACYPPETASLPIAAQRQLYDAMCRLFHQPHPPGISSQDRPIAGVPCRMYRSIAPAPSATQVIYLHGGGFVLGGLDSHDDVCAELCAATGLVVISVDYRLAPEHQHPAALQDALAVIAATPGQLLLVGDSGGATLAAAAAHQLRAARILGQVLIYPMLGGDRSQGSYIAHANAPMLSLQDVEYYAAIRHGGQEPAAGDASSAPLQDQDFSRLPMTLALAAEIDPLADDAAEYAAQIRKAGGRAQALTDVGLVHGWLRARHQVPRAAAAFARICDWVAAMSRGHWPG